jgi:hypothetical protein
MLQGHGAKAPQEHNGIRKIEKAEDALGLSYKIV